MVKKIVALMLAFVGILLCACQNGAPSETQATEPEQAVTEAVLSPRSLQVGICLPGSEARWTEQGQLLAACLEDIGHTALLRYSDHAATQAQQLQALIDAPVDCLVLAAVDALVLEDVLEQAKLRNIPVIALDRMLVNSDVAAVCVAMDRFAAGQQMAHYIIKNTRPSPEGPKTIEFFMGAPEDHGAVLLYKGAMEVLQPYIEAGSLVCKSGRVSFEDTCIQGDLLTTAKTYCLDILKLSGYKKTRPDILCCATDAVAEGCILALEEKPKQLGDSYPVITSVGASPETIKRILEGKQSMSVYCDPGLLAKECASLAQLLLSGKALPALPQEGDGWDETPCLYVTPVAVDAGNYRQILVEEGGYSLWQLLPEGYVEPEPTVPPTEPAPAEATKPTTAPTEATVPSTQPTQKTP